MSQPSTTSGLVRVSVASGTRRVDLVLPGSVPVVELVPELARSVGLLEVATVHGGYRLTTGDGRRLGPDTGLIAQGVEDGGLLTVSAGVEDEPPRVYDDVVEAMADAVERDLPPWEPAAGRRTALVAAALLLSLSAVALLTQDGGPLAGVAAAVVAVLLLAGAVVTSRTRGETATPVGTHTDTATAATLAALAAGYGATAGLLLAPDGPLLGIGLAYAGLGALLAGLAALLGVDGGRALAIPPVLLGAVAGAGGLLLTAVDLDPRVLFVAVLVLVVVAGSVLPWLALGATATRVEPDPAAVPGSEPVTPEAAQPGAVDVARVGADARLAHEILLAVTVTVGVLLVLVTPLAVSLGPAGALLAVTCCVVVMLRTRQYRIGPEVVAGLTSGVVGLVAVAVSVLLLHPSWRPVAALVLAAAGALVLAATLVPTVSPVRRGRLGDLAETAALVALVPLAVLATGLFDLVRG